MCKSFKEKITDTGIKVLENDDMTRLVLNFSNFDIAGFDVDDILSNNGIDIEMSDLFNIVLIVTPSNTQSDMDVLFDEHIKSNASTDLQRKTVSAKSIFLKSKGH